MKSRRSIAGQILFWMAIVGLVPIIAMAVESHYFGRKAIMASEEGHLSFALSSRLIWLQNWFNHTRKEFSAACFTYCPKDDETRVSATINEFQRAFKNLQSGHGSYQFIAVFSTAWEPVTAQIDSRIITMENLREHIPEPFRIAMQDAGEFFICTRNYYHEDGHIFILVGQPVYKRNGEVSAYLVAKLDITQSMQKILGDVSDLGETGKIYLATEYGQILYPVESRPGVSLTDHGIPAEIISSSGGQVLRYRNEHYTPVVGVARKVESIGWYFIAEIGESESFCLLHKAVVAGFATGMIVFILVAWIAYRGAGKISQPLKELASVARDISSGKSKQRAPRFNSKETQEVSEAFNHMLDRLEASRKALAQKSTLAAIGELTSSIVHEMKNPIASVKLNLQALVQDCDKSTDFAEMAAIALEQTKRVDTMLSDLLQYGKPLALKLEKSSFAELMEMVREGMAPLSAQKKVTITVEDLLNDTEICVDREMIVRVLTNLLENGINWSPPGEVIKVRAFPLREEKGWYSITVRDHGPGIPESNRMRLFQPFFSTRKEGTGLGLANVRKIVEYHGGMVAGRNHQEKGAVFSVVMPIGGPLDDEDSGR